MENKRNDVFSKSILSELKEKVGDKRAYYILWLHAPKLLPIHVADFDDLKRKYRILDKPSTKRHICERWMLELRCIEATKSLLKKLHTHNMFVLYNKYYDLAMEGNAEAFDVIMRYNDECLKTNQLRELNELKKITRELLSQSEA